MGDLRAAGAGSCWHDLLDSPRLSDPRQARGGGAGFPGECVRRWGAARTKVRRITAATACTAPARLPPVLAGGRELELTVGQQLAARYQPHLSPAQRAEPAEPVRTLTPRSGPLPAPEPGRLEIFCDAAFRGFRRRPSAAVRRRCSGSILAVSVVRRRRKAAHRCARIAILATAARCHRRRRWPA